MCFRDAAKQKHAKKLKEEQAKGLIKDKEQPLFQLLVRLGFMQEAQRAVTLTAMRQFIKQHATQLGSIQPDLERGDLVELLLLKTATADPSTWQTKTQKASSSRNETDADEDSDLETNEADTPTPKTTSTSLSATTTTSVQTSSIPSPAPQKATSISLALRATTDEPVANAPPTAAKASMRRKQKKVTITPSPVAERDSDSEDDVAEPSIPAYSGRAKRTPKKPRRDLDDTFVWGESDRDFEC